MSDSTPEDVTAPQSASALPHDPKKPMLDSGWRIPFLVVGAGGFAGYDDMTKVKSSLAPPEDVTLEAYEDERPGFLRVTITHDELTGEYFTVPKPGNENKPAKVRHEFTLDLRSHRLA
jgi:hypothetical protein